MNCDFDGIGNGLKAGDSGEVSVGGPGNKNRTSCRLSLQPCMHYICHKYAIWPATYENMFIAKEMV